MRWIFEGMPSTRDTRPARGGRRGRYRIDLPAHMAECDANYLRLMKLFPGLAEADATAIGVDVNGSSMQVRLEVKERSPYTTVVRLSQHPGLPWSYKATITIRLYHDARSAEVVEYQGRKHFLRAVYDYPNADMRQPDEKAQINRFLGEYLALCLRHGVAADTSVLAS
ncbi:MAG TPA: DUF1249 domain-containing protein [Pseudomonadales bacterium]